MTRLKTEWIKDIEHEVKEWDKALFGRTGAGLTELALRGSGLSRPEMEKDREQCRIGVVSITSGQGVIGTFAESVAAIIDALGFTVRVSQKTDVDGLYEARSWGAHVVFMADDERFLAVNLTKHSLGENDRGTARGYVEALKGMMKTKGRGAIQGRKVLLLGYGRVGREIEDYLLKNRAKVVIYDRDQHISSDLVAQGKEVLSKAEEIRNYDLIMDATSTGPWITKDMLHEEALIAAPGIPFSLDEEAQMYYKDQWIHDNLPIGTAVMLAFALGEEDGQ